MTSTTTTSNPKSDGDRFLSLASLRAAHSELLKLHREQGNEPEVLAEIEQFMNKGQATGALLDSEDDRWAAQSLLDYWSSLLYRAGQEPPDATLADFDPSLAPDLSDDLCPYMGLEAFQEKNQNLFFGRQRLIDKLLKHLATNRLLIVVGSSGSGKSSVVLGGLLPQLLSGAIPGSQNWVYYAPLVPGSEPLTTLARRLKPTNVSATEWIPQQVSAFKQNPNHLVQLVEQPDQQPVVLIIDQFEEVFTLCRDDEARQALARNLSNFIQAPTPRNTLILTMRTDFESQFVRTPALHSLFEQSHIRVTALDASELRETIERPAEMVGLRFEEGLADALLSDVLGEPAALPLLQFTLLKLWNNRERNRVTWETYRRLGGGRLALAKSADEFYNNLIPEEQLTVRRILLRMVRPSEGLEVTSKRIPRKDLYLSGEARDRVDRVLDKLVQARLVRSTEGDTLDDAQVEVAHEALIRNWPRLVDWLEDERIALRQRLRLTIAAEQWYTKRRDSSALLRGILLEEARSHRDLNALETEFVEASISIERLKRSRLIVSVTSVFLLLSATSFFALYKAVQFQQQKMKSEQRLIEVELLQKADEVKGLLSNTPEDGLVLAIQITGQSQDTLGRVPVPIQESLRKATEAALSLQTGIGSSVAAFSPNGKIVATASENGIVQLWDRQGKLIKQLPQEHKGIITSVVFSPDGRGLATASADKTVRLWNTSTGQPIGQPLLGHEDTITSVVFSPDGRRLATASADKTVRLWDTNTGQPIGVPLRGHSDSITKVTFSPDGQLILTGSEDNTVRLWNALTGHLLRILISQSSEVTSVAFSPNGRLIASASADGTVALWNREGLLLKTFVGHTSWVTDIAFSPNAQLLATASLDGTIRLWNSDGKLLNTLRNPGGSVTSISFSPDEKAIISSGRDGTTRLWDLQGNIIEEISQNGSWKTLLSFACNGLRDRPVLTNPKNSIAVDAKDTCQKYVWSAK